MIKKVLILSLALSLLASNAIAQTSQASDFRRNDDAILTTTQPNLAPMRASTSRYGEVITIRKPGLGMCSVAATGTAGVDIIPTVANKAYLVSTVNCYNDSTVASIISLRGGTTAFVSDMIGTTTLGNNRVRFDFPNPVQIGTNLNLIMTTTGTSTVCCANYTEVPD